MSKVVKSKAHYKKGRVSNKDYKEMKNPQFTGKNVDNDATWYKKYPALVEAAASIAFNQPYGYNPVIDTVAGTIDHTFDYSAIPGVIAYKYLPMYVEDASEQSAVNIATKNLYTYIRHANSGAANYESSDLMQYLITVMGLITAVEQCKRDIRLVPTFDPLNRYVFTAALRAVGYSDAQIAVMRQTQAINVATLNQVIAQLNTFKVPRDLSLLDRHVWLVSNLWKDDGLRKSSYYLFYNNVIPHYDWANRTVEVHDLGALDLPGRIAAIQTEINNLLAYEDIGIMLGDILKAYKQEGCRVISPMVLGEILDPGYSAEALSQFTNAFVFGRPSFDYEIIQNTSNSQLLEMQSTGNPNGHLVMAIQTDSVSTPTLTDIEINPILTINSDTPSNDEIIIGTRFMIAGHFTKDAMNRFVYSSTHFPTEIILNATLWTFTRKDNIVVLNSTDFQSLNIAIHSTSNPGADDTNEFIRQLRVCSLLDKVEYNPTLYFVRNDVDNDDNEKDVELNYKYLGTNWIPVTDTWLDRLTRGCKQSLYSLPMFKLLETN